MKQRKEYTRDFKVDTVRLCQESGKSQHEFEKEMGIARGNISRWKRELAHYEVKAFPGKGLSRDEEVTRLKREIEILRQEREILKKAMGIFSTPSYRNMNS